MSVKIIFLDIDGVLNCEDWYKQRQSSPILPKAEWDITFNEHNKIILL